MDHSKRTDPLHGACQAHSSSGGSSEIYLPQECEEFGYVIKGTVKLCYGGKVHTVKAGESFYFKAGKKHFIENKSSKDAVLIWVSNPPSF